MPCQLEHLDKRPTIIRFNFLYFSIVLFLITAFVTIIVSLLTKPIPEKYVSKILLNKYKIQYFFIDIGFNSF
jgi:hypothetical protein